jgi:hypothetical protein
MHAISLNLGSDRAGLTMQLLSPVTDQSGGENAGFACVVGAGLLICLAASVAVAHSGALSYWIACFWARSRRSSDEFARDLFSSVFPVASDLSKTGSPAIATRSPWCRARQHVGVRVPR